jgi:hypothetical protein
MDPELTRAWRRWVAAERDGRDDQADVAFRDVAPMLPIRTPRPDFASRVMHAVEREAIRRARVARGLVVVCSVVSVGFAIGVILQLPRLLQAALDAGLAALLWTLVALNRGLDAWAILAQFGRTVAAVVDTPEVTVSIVGLGVVAVAALYGLHRMLELEERSSP